MRNVGDNEGQVVVGELGNLRDGLHTVAPCSARTGLSGLEHQDVTRVRALQQPPCHRSSGNAAADDDRVGKCREVGCAAVVGEVIGRVLPVADCRVGARERDGYFGPFIHYEYQSLR